MALVALGCDRVIRRAAARTEIDHVDGGLRLLGPKTQTKDSISGHICSWDSYKKKSTFFPCVIYSNTIHCRYCCPNLWINIIIKVNILQPPNNATYMVAKRTCKVMLERHVNIVTITSQRVLSQLQERKAV